MKIKPLGDRILVEPFEEKEVAKIMADFTADFYKLKEKYLEKTKEL